MSTKARLFMSGRSQALRLPAKLRMSAREVTIERIGNALWVKPDEQSSSNMGQWLQHFYAQTEPMPDVFLAQRDDPPPQTRKWD